MTNKIDDLDLDVIKQKKLQNKIKRLVKKKEYNNLNDFIRSLTDPEEKRMAEIYRSFYVEMNSKGLLR